MERAIVATLAPSILSRFGSALRVSTAVVLALCAFILAPTLAYRMGPDQGAFAYMGAAFLEGRWPYLQTWENDFPGLVFLQALEMFLLGKSIAMFRLFDLAVQLGNAYLIFRIAAKVNGERVAGCVAAVLFCLIYQGYGPWNTAQREGFGLLFVLAGYWLYFRADRRPDWLTAVGIGLGLGVAVTIKPTLLALAGFYAPLALRLTSRRAWGYAVLAAAALALPMSGIAISYWARGGLAELYDACIGYQAIYTTVLRGSDPLWIYWMHKLGRIGRNAWLLPIVYAPFVAWGRQRGERGMLLVAYLGSVFAVFVQGTFAGYHYLPGLAVGSILLGGLFCQLSERIFRGAELRIGARRVSAQVLVAGLVVAASAAVYLRRAPFEKLATLRFLGPPEPGEFRSAAVFDFTEDFDVAAYLRARTAPRDPIQVWGYESLVYYLAERYASSRFQMTMPLVVRSADGLAPMQLRWRAEFLRDVVQRPPAYIAVVRQDDWWWAPERRTSEELLDDFPEWKRIIERDYHHEQTIGRFLIYRRHPTAGRVALVAASSATDHD